MQLGMIGLGRMGAFMSERLMKAGHQVVGFDRDAAAVANVKSAGAEGAESLAAMVSKLSAPRAVWMMVPAGKPVDDTIADLVKLLAPGDTIIDGGNSYYRDSQGRAAALRDKKISYVDAGTSGGVWGLKEGYSLMVGGGEDVVARLAPIFQALAPAADKGWGRVGPCGAGHFVKMVHNGIEYAIMQAYAEGFDLMRHKTEMQLNLTQIAEIWRFGSVVRSWLLDLSADALTHNPKMEGIEAYVTDSGEGRWTAIEGIELGVPLPALSAALDARLRSQDPAPFADKLLAMMRHEFGGHAVKEDAPAGGTPGKSK
jgi:6-phosphogluconate dehydrogenase